MICLATAHPAKFGEAIARAVGRDLARHPILEALADLPTRCAILSATDAAIREHLERNIRL